MPRLPRKVAASPATNPVQAGHQSQPSALRVPPLPRKTKVDVTKCRACLAKRRWTSPSATPATQSPATNPVQARHQSQPSALSATPATQNESGCYGVPRMPRKTKVDVTKCYACKAKRRWMSPSATPATQSAAASPATYPVQARHQPSALSATPATQN